MAGQTVLRHEWIECARCGLTVPKPIMGGIPRGWYGYASGSEGEALCGPCFGALVMEQQQHYGEPYIDAKAQVLNALMDTGWARGQETWRETRQRLLERAAAASKARSREHGGNLSSDGEQGLREDESDS